MLLFLGLLGSLLLLLELFEFLFVILFVGIRRFLYLLLRYRHIFIGLHIMAFTVLLDPMNGEVFVLIIQAIAHITCYK